MQKVAYIEDIIFMNKQNIPWAEVESYLKQYVGQKYIVEETQDVIHIGTDFPEEFSESRYTKTLRGSISKAKANAAQVIGKMVVIATNKRWVENKNEKHKKMQNKGGIGMIRILPCLFKGVTKKKVELIYTKRHW